MTTTDPGDHVPTDPDPWLRDPSNLAGIERLVEDRLPALRPRVARALADRAQLLDVDRVLLRLAAVFALSDPPPKGKRAAEAWLEARIGEALDVCLAEGSFDAPAASPGVDQVHEGAPSLDSGSTAAACRRFNELPRPAREAFRLLVIDGLALDEAAESTGRSAPGLAQDARLGLLMLLGKAPLS